MIILIAFTPSLALLWYFYHKDKYEPEPKRYVIVTFLYGALFSTALAMFLENAVGYFIQRTAITMALTAAIVEEPAKALAIRIPYKAKQMDGIMDGVVYGVAAGLGFAATENLIYGLGFGAGTTLVRALLPPLAHASWSAVIGVGYGLKAEGKGNLFIFFFTAILLHFFWDYSVFMSLTNPFYLSMVFLILFLNLVLIKYFIKVGLKEDKLKFGKSY